MCRDSNFCANSVRYNIFTNGAPYSNTNVERSWFNSPDTGTHLMRNTVTWRPVSGGHQHRFSWGARSYAFLTSTKHVKTSSAYSQDFSKFCWREKFGLYCYGRNESCTWYHSGLIQLFRGMVFPGTWQRKCQLDESSQKALRAAQKVLEARVFETPAVLYYSKLKWGVCFAIK